MDTTDYLKSIITPIVTRPEEVTVDITHDDMGVLLTLGVHSADMGLVIGKEGETAKCIRHLVRIIGLKNEEKVGVKIKEPAGSRYKYKN